MTRALARVGCLLLFGGCAAQRPAQEAAPAHVASAPAQPVAAAQAPLPSDAPNAAPATPEAAVGISACDEYLDVYKRCEPTLQPTIAAGGARTWKAEAAWLQYLRGTPEGAGLQQWCLDALHSLRGRCGAREGH